MASLLKQVAWPAAEEDRSYLRTIYEKIKVGDDPPTRETIIDLFIHCARSLEVRVLFDALDECNENEVGKIYNLIRKLREADIGVYMTTRPHIAGELRTRFPDGFYMESIKSDDKDVRKVLERRIQDHGKSIGTDFIDQIVCKIGNSQGMYGLSMDVN
jgi:hypothetical protein